MPNVLVRDLDNEVLEQLKARRPRYLIFERNVSRSAPVMGKAVDTLPQHPAVAELLEAYAFETQIEDFALYRLR